MPSSIESDLVCHLPTWPAPNGTSGMRALGVYVVPSVSNGWPAAFKTCA